MYVPGAMCWSVYSLLDHELLGFSIFVAFGKSTSQRMCPKQ